LQHRIRKGQNSWQLKTKKEVPPGLEDYKRAQLRNISWLGHNLQYTENHFDSGMCRYIAGFLFPKETLVYI